MKKLIGKRFIVTVTENEKEREISCTVLAFYKGTLSGMKFLVEEDNNNLTHIISIYEIKKSIK